MNSNDIYLQAMRGSNGTINVGYLVLFRSGRAVIIICFAILAMGVYSIATEKTNTAPIIHETGIAIAAIIAAFGVLLGAVGAFLWGDSKQTTQVGTATTTTTTTATTPNIVPDLAGVVAGLSAGTTAGVGTAGDPLQVAVVDMPPADKPRAKGNRRAK